MALPPVDASPIEVRNHADTEGFADGSDCENEGKQASQTVRSCYREASFGKCLADIGGDPGKLNGWRNLQLFRDFRGTGRDDRSPNFE